MFLVYTNSLNPNEQIVLEKMLKATGVYPFQIVHCNKEMPAKELAYKHYPILVYDATKSKPALIKKLEVAYGKEFLALEHLEISRPNTFQSIEELRTEVWDKLVSIRSKVNTKEVYFDKIPTVMPKELTDIINGGERKVYLFHIDDQCLELHPAEIAATTDNSLTYEEFLIMLTARFMFSFDRVEIISTAI